ncbi:MAG TPA: carbonic anhydrase [Alphaproteobacteria bacterium]|nr:carbonic anhydrase [Alphaproteobacteria bacterium]
MDDLIAGYRRFRHGIYPAHGETYRTLAAEGQSPGVMVIGCCDSRVDPAAIFDAGPGALFVLRNVANLVPPYATDGGHHGTSAAIEFAVGGLGVDHILVLGHAACGGIKALIEGARGAENADSHIGRWMTIARPALESLGGGAYGRDSERFARSVERAAIGHSLENLKQFPMVRDAMATRGLRLHGAWFDIETGALHLRDDADGAFHPVQAEMS